jgi:hypothetical protein
MGLATHYSDVLSALRTRFYVAGGHGVPVCDTHTPARPHTLCDGNVAAHPFGCAMLTLVGMYICQWY